MNEWKPYLNDRLIKECEGFYVIKPVEERQIVPLSCPVCDYLMRTVDDEKSYLAAIEISKKSEKLFDRTLQH